MTNGEHKINLITLDFFFQMVRIQSDDNDEKGEIPNGWQMKWNQGFGFKILENFKTS